MNTSVSQAVNEAQAIEISVATLLALRHVPTPTLRSVPISNSTWLGAFTSHKRGHGTEYDDLRPYSPGDDIRHIDWRASARTHALHTRLYREEKDHRTRIICDLRQCMFTGSNQLRANRAVTLSARVLWQACHGGTRVTLMLITPSGISMIAPGTGHATAIQGCNLLAQEHQRIAAWLEKGHRRQRVRSADSEQDSVTRPSESSTLPDNISVDEHSRQQALPVSNTAHGPTLDAMLQWLVAHGEHRTTQLWISGFDYEGEQFFHTLASIANQSQNLAIHIDDPVLNKALPAGEFHYQSPEKAGNGTGTSSRRALVGKSNQGRLNHTLNQIKQNRAARFDELMIPYLSISNGYDEVISALRHTAWLA